MEVTVRDLVQTILLTHKLDDNIIVDTKYDIGNVGEINNGNVIKNIIEIQGLQDVEEKFFHTLVNISEENKCNVV